MQVDEEPSGIANAGDANAQKILGALYLNGHDGVAKDTALARQWLQKAADQGAS